MLAVEDDVNEEAHTTINYGDGDEIKLRMTTTDNNDGRQQWTTTTTTTNNNDGHTTTIDDHNR